MMTRGEEQGDLQFIESTIRWLALIPGTPINCNSGVNELISPYKLYHLLLSMLRKEDFGIVDDYNPYSQYFQNEYAIDYLLEPEHQYIVPTGLIDQLSLLEKILASHTANFFQGSDLRELQINWLKAIILSDIHEIACICRLLICIGTTSSPLATNALQSVEYLDVADQQRIDFFLKLGAKKFFNSPEAVPKGDSGRLTGELIEEDTINGLVWENDTLDKIIYLLAHQLTE